MKGGIDMKATIDMNHWSEMKESGNHMKMSVELDIDKYLKKKTDTDYLEIDSMGMVWLVHETESVKHFRLATEEDWKEWGLEDVEFHF